MRNVSFAGFLFLFILLSCQRSGEPVGQEREGAPCGETAQINADGYQNGPSEKAFIKNAYVQGDCLTISFTGSGCNSDTWQTDLLDAGAIAKSLPPQRSLRMKLITNQACLAVFSKTVSFDIFPLRVDGVKKVTLNLDGYNEALTYSY